MDRRVFLSLLGGGALTIANTAVAGAEQLFLASRQVAEAAYIPEEIALLQVLRDGQIYQYVRDAEGTALMCRDGSSWSPAEAPNLLHWGVAADGTGDDAEAITQFVAYLDRTRREGYVPAGRYAVSYVRNRELQFGLAIRCHPEARFEGLPTKEIIEDLSAGSHHLSAFQANPGGVRVTVNRDGREVSLRQGKDFEFSDNTITWASDSPHLAKASGPVTVVSASPMIELGVRNPSGSRCEWTGGVIDNGRRGFAPARASGSGLVLTFFEQYEVSGVSFLGAADYETAKRNGVTDTSLTIDRCSGGMISGNRFSGQADLGIYITGGNEAGDADNGIHHVVQGNYFVGCNGGVSAKRDVRGVKILANTFEACFVGAAFYNTTQRGEGGRGIISGNEFIRSARAAIDVRATRNVIVSGNVIRDIGETPSGQVQPGSAGIDLRGVSYSAVSDNLVVLEEFSGQGSVGIRLGPDETNETIDCTKLVITGNALSRLETGIREQGAGDDNLFRENYMSEVAQPMDVPDRRAWQYRDPRGAHESTG
ncbi:right-handed parallel beta-helix repeat-containing protein [Salipiger pacificus]|nr:right-handed parallel beta-helix repeat-containing protein [Alloyangia pacifica]MCA0948038.1 right-handed parallel beta-helix repeat-containing protein [Alloyangia pacifica]